MLINDAFSELESAVSQLKGVQSGDINPETITLEGENPEPEPSEPETPSEPEPEQPKEEEEPEVPEPKEEEPEPDTKKQQSPEENRRFAEQRRQQELERRVQEELNKRLQETPEIQAMRQLQELGYDPNTLVEQATLAQLQQQSQQTGIPLEVLQQQQQQAQQTNQLQQQLAQVQFQLWEAKVQNEVSQIQSTYPSLSDEDMQQAVDYMVNTLQRTDLPLEQAVMAVHGQKIMQSLKDQARNEVLAEKSGRTTPLQPQGGKAPSTPSLSNDEKFVAKMMGLSEEDYLKYK
jgi:outer membrane biosynthesis protein TonB